MSSGSNCRYCHRSGNFETPAIVASQAGSNTTVLLFWLMGGVVSLVGGLYYAELATVYRDVGGVYYYLKRAFGRGVAFLFAWARLLFWHLFLAIIFLRYSG